VSLQNDNHRFFFPKYKKIQENPAVIILVYVLILYKQFVTSFSLTKLLTSIQYEFSRFVGMCDVVNIHVNNVIIHVNNVNRLQTVSNPADSNQVNSLSHRRSKCSRHEICILHKTNGHQKHTQTF
jgi:hypothetical protein